MKNIIKSDNEELFNNMRNNIEKLSKANEIASFN